MVLLKIRLFPAAGMKGKGYDAGSALPGEASATTVVVMTITYRATTGIAFQFKDAAYPF